MRLWQYLQHLEWSHGYSIPLVPFPDWRCLPGPNLTSPNDHSLPWSSTSGGAPGTLCQQGSLRTLLFNFLVQVSPAGDQSVICTRSFLRWAPSTMWTRQVAQVWPSEDFHKWPKHQQQYLPKLSSVKGSFFRGTLYVLIFCFSTNLKSNIKFKTSPQAKRHLSSVLWLSWLSSLDNFHLLINFITG